MTKSPSKTIGKGVLPPAATDQEIQARYSTMLWTKLVTDGHVIMRRVNHCAKTYGATMGVLAMVLLAFDAARSSGILSQDEASASGWAVNAKTVNEWSRGMNIASITPAFGSATTKVEDYKAFIAQVIQNPGSLAPQGKAVAGQVACVPIRSLAEPWVNPATGLPDKPRCKFSDDGNTIWVASHALDSASGKAVVYPVLGLFHKEGGRWGYYNFDARMPGALYAFPEYKTVTFSMIPEQLARDFPDAMTRADLSEPRGWIERAKKAFAK